MKYKDFNREILKCDYKDGWGRWPSDSSKGIPMPPAQKPYSADSKIIDLVSPDLFDFDLKLVDAIANRRSRRKFTEDLLTIKELSFLLWSTQGVTDEDVSAHRAVPSAGSRHPFETYLVIRRVADLRPGIYRYLPLEHKLAVVSVRRGIAEEIADSCFEVNQHHLQSAAVVFIWTVIPYRTEWRTGPYAYKFIALDAGHMCQNLYLATEAIDAGTCAVGVYNQTELDEFIGVNGKDEFIIYLATVGKTEQEESGE